MKLTAEEIERLEHFLEKIKRETYAEVPTDLHTEITAKMIDWMWGIHAFPKGSKVLDVGCGQGVALKHFASRGLDATGVTLNRTDVEVCQGLGYRVLEMDQSFLNFPEEAFDLLWCRHCLEHSIFPYFTLSSFHRVLKRGGWLYIEVPAPDTVSRHQNNKNHYSVLGKSMLTSLIERSGFKLRETTNIDMELRMGSGQISPEQYWAFLQQKV